MDYCGTCKFYEPIGDIGFCKRFPPEADGKGPHSIDEPPTVRLMTTACGEYKRKDKK